MPHAHARQDLDNGSHRPRAVHALLAALLVLLGACSGESGETSRGAAEALPRRGGAGAPAGPRTGNGAAREAAAPVATVAVLGDSISAGLHLDADEAFPALLAARLAEDGLPVRLINAGVSGDTSAGGLRRVDWLLEQEPDVLVVELGGNDGLRGQPLDAIRDNLSAIVDRAEAAGARVVLLGMALPPNLGPAYTSGFRALYDELAEERGLAYVPFFMEPVAGRTEFNLRDGMHPNAAGHGLLAERVYPVLREVVGGVAAGE